MTIRFADESTFCHHMLQHFSRNKRGTEYFFRLVHSAQKERIIIKYHLYHTRVLNSSTLFFFHFCVFIDSFNRALLRWNVAIDEIVLFLPEEAYACGTDHFDAGSHFSVRLTWHSHFFHLLFSPYTFFCEISLATKEGTRTRFCLRMRSMMCEVLKATSDANVSQQASIGTFVFRNANIAFCKDGGVVRSTTSKGISQRHLWDFGAREDMNSTGKISTRHTKHVLRSSVCFTRSHRAQLYGSNASTFEKKIPKKC